jgi:hypothetical protein
MIREEMMSHQNKYQAMKNITMRVVTLRILMEKASRQVLPILMATITLTMRTIIV